VDVVDPWRLMPDRIRRVLGRPLPPRDDLYEIPESLWADDARG
jgi:hypothetical protein